MRNKDTSKGKVSSDKDGVHQGSFDRLFSFSPLPSTPRKGSILSGILKHLFVTRDNQNYKPSVCLRYHKRVIRGILDML